MTASPTPRTAAAPSSAHSAANSPAPLSGTALAELTAALAVRELQLRTRLVRNGHAVPEADITHNVADLKDRAAEGAQQAVDDAEADVLRGQHARVGAALRRAHEHRYGLCLGCGEAISLERLRALPEAELCLPCQRTQEGVRRTPPAR